MAREEGRTPRPIDAIRVYLRLHRIPTHSPEDGCPGCHKARVLSELRSTSKGDSFVFLVFLRLAMEAQ